MGGLQGDYQTLAWWLKQDQPPTVKEMAIIIERLAIAPIFSPR
jgi:hypothetical protein